MANQLLALTRHPKERLTSVLLAPAPASSMTNGDSGVGTGESGNLRWPRRIWAESRPGDAGLPLLGHTVDYIRFGSEFSRERYERLGSVSWMGAFGTKMVVIAGPDATREAFTSEAKAFLRMAGPS